MKKSKRIMSFLLVTLIALSVLLSSCAGQSNSPAPDPSTTTPGSSTGTDSDNKNAEEPLEFTFMARTRPPYDPEQYDIWNELMARTNTKINFMWVPQANFTEKVNTVLAGGDIPEVIFEPDIALMLNQGAIIPLDDLINEHAPNLSQLLEPEDYVYLRQVIDGKIYHVPHILDFPPSMTMLIRKDWVENVGMELPETWEEWKAVWTAFKEQDANKDGDKTNEIPLMVTETIDLLNYATAFGIQSNNEFFCTTEDNQIIAIYDHPNFKAFLTELVDLYAKGILDKEFPTRINDYKAMMDNNIAGSTLYYAERAKLTTDVLRESIPEAAMYPVAPIKSADGKQLIKARTKLGLSGAVFTITAQKTGKAERIMDFYNYVYSDEGSFLLNYGLEGKHHNMVEGKPVINAEITKGGFNEARKVGIIPSITPYNFMEDAYLQILLGGQSVDALPESTQFFYDGLMLNEPYFYSVVPVFSTPTYVEKSADLRDKLMEIFANTIVGKLSVDDFFTEYEKIKANGFAQIVTEQQEAYEKVSQ